MILEKIATVQKVYQEIEVSMVTEEVKAAEKIVVLHQRPKEVEVLLQSSILSIPQKAK